MGAVLELSEKLWSGEVTTDERHPFAALETGEEVAKGAFFYNSFANVTAFSTDEGLVLVDAGTFAHKDLVFQSIREWSAERVDTVIYTHGHVDHVFCAPLFADEAKERGWTPPRVVAHEAVARRFDRYIHTAGYNSIINQRQFSMPIEWPTSYTYPDTTYDKAMTLSVGGFRFELHHARGETDDHTWVWAPERRVLCTGDLIIWAVPNAGNPQKVPRYCIEWAEALRKMAALNAEALCPGHGVAVVGEDRVRQMLLETAELLESLQEQTIDLMNQGATLDTIIHTVRVPERLEDRPFLQPVYDDPQYIVRNIWRLFGGWHDGNPAHLRPAPEAEQAAEIAKLAGGVSSLIERARELLQADELRLACHVIEWAAAAAPTDKAVHGLRAEIYGRRIEQERALMTTGIFRAAERESQAVMEGGASK
jgi:alkyl sulfatase BDS1-like metallo-beta-lactamase superfamily hydrolase